MTQDQSLQAAAREAADMFWAEGVDAPRAHIRLTNIIARVFRPLLAASEDEAKNTGATIMAGMLRRRAEGMPHTGVFVGAEIEAAAQAIVALRAERDALQQRVAEIAARACVHDRYGAGERCPEAEALAMGGRIPKDEQRRRWCLSCIAREPFAPAPPTPGEKEPSR